MVIVAFYGIIPMEKKAQKMPEMPQKLVIVTGNKYPSCMNFGPGAISEKIPWKTRKLGR